MISIKFQQQMPRIIRMMLIIFFIMQAFLFTKLFSQSAINTAKMDSLVNGLVLNKKMMLSVAISKDGQVIYSHVTGYAKINSTEKVWANTDTRYRIGSITKTFTSVMIHQLIEEGKLSLETPLSKFYPKIPNAKKITISQMLRHQSGIHNFTDDPAYLDYYTQPHTEEQMIQIIAATTPDFDPGKGSSYSNSAYVLLGYIIEKVTKTTYAENLKTRIVNRVGLTSTYYGGAADIKNNEARSYRFKNNEWVEEPETDMTVPGGAGAILSTPTDLLTFIHGLFQYRLLKKESVDEMMTLTGNFGSGIYQMPFYDKTAYGHNGGIDEFVSVAGYFPEDGLGIAMITNGYSYSLNNVMIGLLSIYYNKEYTLPSFTRYEVAESILGQYTGKYHNDELPMDLTITKEGTTLSGQATGQSAFELEADNETTFHHEMAGVILEFFKDPEGKITHLLLKQRGKEYNFKRL